MDTFDDFFFTDDTTPLKKRKSSFEEDGFYSTSSSPNKIYKPNASEQLLNGFNSYSVSVSSSQDKGMCGHAQTNFFIT